MIPAASKYIQRERNIRVFFFILAHFTAITAIFLIPYVLISTVLAIVTYYLLQPIVDFIEFKRINRSTAAIIPFAILGGVFYFLSANFLPLLTGQLLELQTLAPTYLVSLKKLLAEIELKANPVLTLLKHTDLLEQIQNYLIDKATLYMNKLPDLISAAVTTSFLTPFFAYFFLVDGKGFYRTFLKIVPNHLFEIAIQVNHEINVQMGQFIRARLLESAIVAIIIFAGLSMIQFPYSLLLSLFAALLNLVPYIGPVIGALPALILVFISPESQSQFGPVTLIYLLAQFVDNVIIVPFVVAKIVNLHPIAVVISVLLGAQLLGTMGMLISIPLASAFKIFIEAFYRHLTNARAD
jgi:putative permease